jgi:hypothetical protein
MKIEEVIFILENKVRTLEQQRSAAISAGDLASVIVIDTQITETKTTLDTLAKQNSVM